MRGPFVLSKSCVNMVVPPRMLGVFALSNSKDSVEVLRRADRNACEEIKNCFQEFKYFWFELAASPREAFRIECECYHAKLASKANDKTHPEAPAGSGWQCPVCKQ